MLSHACSAQLAATRGGGSVAGVAGCDDQSPRLLYLLTWRFPWLVLIVVGWRRGNCKAHQLRHVPHAEFFHDPGLVHLDRSRAYVQGRRDFLGVQPLRSLLQHLALSGREPAELLGIRAPGVIPLNPTLLQREGGLDSRAQLHVIKGFLKEIHCLRPERGLTVIANAPNPAGFAILKDHFQDQSINAFGLFVAAMPPALVGIACFRGIQGPVTEIFDWDLWAQWFSGLDRAFLFLLILPFVVAAVGLWAEFSARRDK